MINDIIYVLDYYNIEHIMDYKFNYLKINNNLIYDIETTYWYYIIVENKLHIRNKTVGQNLLRTLSYMYNYERSECNYKNPSI